MGYRLNYEISLFRDTFYLNKLQSGSHKRKGAKGIHILNASFKTYSEIYCYTDYIFIYYWMFYSFKKIYLPLIQEHHKYL